MNTLESTEAASVFGLLSDETRIRIVAALYHEWHRSPDDPCLTFSSLYDRVGGDDSGQFNYHLRRLRDGLVDQREDGYTLTPLGVCLAQLVADENVAIV